MKSFTRKSIIGIFLIILLAVGLWFQKASFPPELSASKNERLINKLTLPDEIRRTSLKSMGKPTIRANSSNFQPSKVLMAGGLTIPVVFQDEPHASLTEEQRAEVIKDIQMVYGHLGQSEMYGIDRKVLTVGGIELPILNKIQFNGSGRYFPPAHRDTFGLISGGPDHYQLVIPSELIADYRQALDFISAHRQAFDSLRHFLPESGNNSEAWAGLAASDVVWTPATLKMTAGTQERIFSEMKNARFRMPSLLDFSVAEKGARDFGLPELPEGAIVGRVLLLDEGNIPQNYEVVIYVDNKWKIAVVPPGT